MDLLPALAVVAVVVLAGLGLHAWWAGRQAAPRQAQAPERAAGPGPEPDAGAAPGASALTGTARIEPTLGLIETPADSLRQDLAGRPGPRIPGRLDPLIDVVVALAVDEPVSGDIAVAHLPASWRAGSKPMHIEGLELGSGQWEQPARGRRYSEFQAGVQLANRSGALTPIEYSEFVQKIQDFAETIGAAAELPDMLEVMARARELDAFARPLDAELSVTLQAASTPWSVGYVAQCAARQRLVPGGRPGRWVLPGAEEGDPPVITLQFDAQAALDEAAQASALRSIQITLDVAHTPREAEPYPAWHRIVTALAAEMDAQVVDAEGAVLTVGVFDQIGRDLQRLYDELDARDLAAGTPAARRLFS